MTYVITNGCCSDASCIPVCPVQCIRPRPGDPDFTTAEQLYIDPATCIDCGACMDECPVNAIHPEWDLPEELDDYLAINADYFSEQPHRGVRAPRPAAPRFRGPDPSFGWPSLESGPAGCYAAAALSDSRVCSVSMFGPAAHPLRTGPRRRGP